MVTILTNPLTAANYLKNDLAVGRMRFYLRHRIKKELQNRNDTKNVRRSTAKAYVKRLI